MPYHQEHTITHLQVPHLFWPSLAYKPDSTLLRRHTHITEDASAATLVDGYFNSLFPAPGDLIDIVHVDHINPSLRTAASGNTVIVASINPVHVVPFFSGVSHSYQITPLDYGAVADDATNDWDAFQAAIAAAAAFSVDRDGPYVEVDLFGRSYGIGQTIKLVNASKVKLVNGRLFALPSLAGDPIISLGDGGAVHPQFCGLNSLDLECNGVASGLLIDGSNGQHVCSVRIHGMVPGGYGLRTQTDSGAGVYERVNIAQYWANEAGGDLIANRTALGFDIQKADDIFIGCIASQCLTPLKIISSPAQFVGCHFFNGGTVDGVNNLIIDKAGGGTTQFIGCYLDNGLIRITDNFRTTWDGCIFIKNTNGNQNSFFDLITTVAGETGSGFGLVGCEFRFAAVSDGIIKYSTSGGGSWATDKKIVWHGNRRGDTSDVPYALAQWQDYGVLDDHGRFILGRTASQSIAGLQPQIQVIAPTEIGSSYAALKTGADANPPHIILAKSRGDGKGTFVALNSLDLMGLVQFAGDDGVNIDTVGAAIRARTAAAWSGVDHSTEVIFRTISGAGALTDRIFLEKDGHWRPATDNVISSGLANKRWANIYGTNLRPGDGIAIWTSGNGSPEGIVAAPVGSLYVDLNGAAGTTFYIKESGVSNTGWVSFFTQERTHTANKVTLVDDFLGALLPEQWTSVGGSNGSVVTAFVIPSSLQGLVRLTTGADAGGTLALNGVEMYSGSNWRASNGNLIFECRFQISAITDIALFIGFTDNTAVLEMPIHSAGVGDTITTDASNAVGIMFDTAMTTDNWWLVGVKSNVDATPQNSGVAPVAATFETWRIEITTAGAASFYRNNTLIGTAMSNAIATSAILSPVIAAFSRAAASRNIDADYVYLQMDR